MPHFPTTSQLPLKHTFHSLQIFGRRGSGSGIVTGPTFLLHTHMSVSDLYHIRRAIQRDKSVGYVPDALSKQGRSRLCGMYVIFPHISISNDGSCLTNEASYTCPTCQAPYCSITCFRGASHACAPSFAARTVRENLGPEDTRVDEAERKRIMEILWRLETGEGVIDDDDDDDDGADEDDGDDDHNVSVENRKRIQDHPLTEDIPVDQLLRMLTMKERDRFAMLLRHPEQAAKIYFTDAQDVSSPWWASSTHGAHPWEHVSSYTPFASLARAETQVDLRFHLMYLWYVDGPPSKPTHALTCAALSMRTCYSTLTSKALRYLVRTKIARLARI